MDIEYKRRPTSYEIQKKLKQTGFSDIKKYSLWETRKTYQNLIEMTSDLRNRTGRSILHELSDEQIEDLIEYIFINILSEEILIEKDRWIIWTVIR